MRHPDNGAVQRMGEADIEPHSFPGSHRQNEAAPRSPETGMVFPVADLARRGSDHDELGELVSLGHEGARGVEHGGGLEADQKDQRIEQGRIVIFEG